LKKEVGKNCFSYKEITFDDNGWADSNKFIPLAYDLVTMRVERGGEKIIYNGWWTGTQWEARKNKNHDKVLEWKKCLYENF